MRITKTYFKDFWIVIYPLELFLLYSLSLASYFFGIVWVGINIVQIILPIMIFLNLVDTK